MVAPTSEQVSEIALLSRGDARIAYLIGVPLARVILPFGGVR